MNFSEKGHSQKNTHSPQSGFSPVWSEVAKGSSVNNFQGGPLASTEDMKPPERTNTGKLRSKAPKSPLQAEDGPKPARAKDERSGFKSSPTVKRIKYRQNGHICSFWVMGMWYLLYYPLHFPFSKLKKIKYTNDLGVHL